MSYSSAAQRYLIKIIGQQFGLSAYEVEEFLANESTYSTVSDFLKGDERVPKLVFFYQTRDTITDDGELIAAPGARFCSALRPTFRTATPPPSPCVALSPLATCHQTRRHP